MFFDVRLSTLVFISLYCFFMSENWSRTSLYQRPICILFPGPPPGVSNCDLDPVKPVVLSVTEGKVECVALVGQTSVSNETTLQIYTVEMTAPPSAVLRGSQATISCTITPTPPVPDVLTIVWCQNGGTLSSSTHSGCHSLQPFTMTVALLILYTGPINIFAKVLIDKQIHNHQ